MGVNALRGHVTVYSGYEHEQPTEMYLLERLDEGTNDEDIKGLMASGVLLY